MRDVRLNTSSCQVYMGLREGEEPALGLGPALHVDAPHLRLPRPVRHARPEPHVLVLLPQGRPGSDRYTIVSSTNARWEDWADMDDAAYAPTRRAWIERRSLSIESHVPGRARQDRARRGSTPRTFRFYTAAPAGASFGTKFEGLPYSHGASPNEIEGLYHAGSVGIIMSGWLGAANYGAITANKVDAYLASLLPSAP